MNSVSKIFIGLSVIIFLGIGANVAYAGFGISPPSVTNKSLLPGSSYEQTVYIVRSNPDETLLVKTMVDAGNINSWITIQNGNEFEIPSGIQQFPMKVLVNVPFDAQVGEYKGAINLLTSSKTATEQSAPVKVNFGADVSINLQVGNSELIDYNIQGLNIKDTERNSPIILIVKVQNKGNTSVGPTKVNVEFYDIYHSKKIWEGQKDISEKVSPFSVRDISIELPSNLELGQYWADVEFFDGEESINKNKIVFTIIEPKTATKFLDFVSKNRSVVTGIGLLLAVVLLVGLGWKLLRRTKKENVL